VVNVNLIGPWWSGEC